MTLQTAEPTYRCVVPGGCGLTLRSGQHKDLTDCVNTGVVYVERYLQIEPVVADLEREIIRLREQNKTLLEANQRLVGG